MSQTIQANKRQTGSAVLQTTTDHSTRAASATHANRRTCQSTIANVPSRHPMQITLVSECCYEQLEQVVTDVNSVC